MGNIGGEREAERCKDRGLGQIWTMWKWASFASGKISEEKLIRKSDYEGKGKGLRKKRRAIEHHAGK